MYVGLEPTSGLNRTECVSTLHFPFRATLSVNVRDSVLIFIHLPELKREVFGKRIGNPISLRCGVEFWTGCPCLCDIYATM